MDYALIKESVKINNLIDFFLPCFLLLGARQSISMDIRALRGGAINTVPMAERFSFNKSSVSETEFSAAAGVLEAEATTHPATTSALDLDLTMCKFQPIQSESLNIK